MTDLASQLRPITAERLANTTHTVSQPGLARADMGDQGFEMAMEERRRWIGEHCRGDHMIEPMRQDGRLVGRRYRFEDPNEAVWFRMRF